jgi:hypothetical protein
MERRNAAHVIALASALAGAVPYSFAKDPQSRETRDRLAAYPRVVSTPPTKGKRKLSRAERKRRKARAA